jgi:hypothetical protein
VRGAEAVDDGDVIPSPERMRAIEACDPAAGTMTAVRYTADRRGT